MLSGNPDTFAIWCDPVESWSTSKFQNGCLGFFIGGKLICSTRSTLGVDLHGLSLLHCMSNAVEDGLLLNLASIDAYRTLCERAFPSIDSEADTNDFSHLVSAESLSDEGHYVFLVEGSGQAKLIYGFKDDLQSVYEIVVGLGEFQSVVRDVLGKSKPAQINS
ncbi:immunity 42 family protein [Paraburkholderia bannensis]|uniref:immunity 42 family protein n=1 Tax=Paraburkholderia bannensis TaxID=765414 RepID=UPI002ABD5CFB|nr:immunity 42 family protein [Paraburkholderia bannensis]